MASLLCIHISCKISLPVVQWENTHFHHHLAMSRFVPLLHTAVIVVVCIILRALLARTQTGSVCGLYSVRFWPPFGFVVCLFSTFVGRQSRHSLFPFGLSPLIAPFDNCLHAICWRRFSLNRRASMFNNLRR